MTKKLPKMDLTEREKFCQQFLYDQCIVQWVDITGEGGGWLTQLQAIGQETSLVVTFGIPYKLEEGCLSMASSITDNRDYSDVTTMPVSNITAIHKLREL